MNFNDKKIKELYKTHAEQNAPDMDALWERIERGLDEKNSEDISGVTSSPVKKSITFRKTALRAALAAAAVLIMLPAAFQTAFRGVNTSDMAAGSGGNMQNSAEVNPAAPNVDQEAAYDAAESENGYDDSDFDGGAAETVPSDENISVGTVLYESLNLAPAEAVEDVPTGETSGDDFFVEANVLIHTDVIVNAYVDRAYSRGGTVCYELTAENADTRETENITIESATPYRLLENRSYVLPLKNDGEGYSLAFENAPQIEITLDGGIIFHNGWVTLDDESAVDVIYPQNGIDDFFYDRMKFSYSADADTLVKKWHELKGEN
ncbi:MAG: hypothetical protein K2J73_04005 [Oscillospiraceae bacterium]|nr:hypothetical protein [Oscillospiraceae bacterium]